MMDGIEFKIGDREDIAGMVTLQKKIYPQYKRDMPFFTWQCFENVNPSVLVVARHGSSVVGTLGIQRIETESGLHGGQLSWIVVEKDRRRNGLFARMSALALEKVPGLDFIFIFANQEAVVPCERKLGMRFIGSPGQLALRPGLARPPAGSRLEPVDAQTRFPVVPCRRGAATFSRTEPYRRWRYARSTVYRYYKVSTAAGDYAIVKLFGKPGSPRAAGDIVDLECDLFDTERSRELFLAASFELKRMGASTVTTWAPPWSGPRHVLEDMGFEKDGNHSFFGIKVLDPCNDDLYDFEKWHLVQSDASNY